MKQTSMSGACQEMRGRGATAEALTVRTEHPRQGQRGNECKMKRNYRKTRKQMKREKEMR
jgi:hypothetical protein